MRDTALSRYHMYEFALGGVPDRHRAGVGTVITGMVVLGWLSGFLGIAGLAFTMLGLWVPHALDFLTHAAH